LSVRRKNLFPVLMIYAAAALLLPVLPANKMASGHSRKSIASAWLATVGPETVSAKGRDDVDRYFNARDE
jgi:hypothetical protein